MFVQGLIEILVIIGFGWLAWKLIAKPIIESKGIDVDEEKDVKTDYVKRLLKAEKEFKEKAASVEAVREEKKIKTTLVDIEKEIKSTDEEIKNLK